MLLPRPRFSLRWLMVAVAVAGVLIHTERRRQLFLGRVREIELAQYIHEDRNHDEAGTWTGSDLARWLRKQSHYDALKVKYERAARYPWLPVVPDPPEPE